MKNISRPSARKVVAWFMIIAVSVLVAILVASFLAARKVVNEEIVRELGSLRSNTALHRTDTARLQG